MISRVLPTLKAFRSIGIWAVGTRYAFGTQTNEMVQGTVCSLVPWAGAVASCGASVAMVYCTKISITATVATIYGMNTEEDAVKALILCIAKSQVEGFFSWAFAALGQPLSKDELNMLQVRVNASADFVAGLPLSPF